MNNWQTAFWDKVDKSGSCWLWMRARNRQGYGVLGKGPKRSQSLCHRISWQLSRGPIPEGMFVLHKCDVPACVNPEHLFIGTQDDNMKDCARKGRHASKRKSGYLPKGESHHYYKEGPKITREMALEIRAAIGSQKGMAAKYGVHPSLISKIKNGHIWRE